jgi:hypothetical protein
MEAGTQPLAPKEAMEAMEANGNTKKKQKYSLSVSLSSKKELLGSSCLEKVQVQTELKNHPGTKLMFPARLPTSLSTSSEFHSQVRDGLAWFH